MSWLRTLRDSQMQNTKTPRQYKNLVSLLLNDKIERQQKHQFSSLFSDPVQIILVLAFCFSFYCPALPLLKDSSFPLEHLSGTLKMTLFPFLFLHYTSPIDNLIYKTSKQTNPQKPQQKNPKSFSTNINNFKA